MSEQFWHNSIGDQITITVDDPAQFELIRRRMAETHAAMHATMEQEMFTMMDSFGAKTRKSKSPLRYFISKWRNRIQDAWLVLQGRASIND